MSKEQYHIGETGQRALWRKRRSIRITILMCFVGLLLLTAVPIVGFMHYRNTDALLELADELMVQLSAIIIEKTGNYLSPAAVMAEMSARLEASEAPSLAVDADLETYAITVLKAYPQLAMFNMADERGNFLMPKKMPDGSIATKTIDRDAVPPTVTWKYRDIQGVVVRRETSTEMDYDPRIRPWYQGAVAAGGRYWTDMYILFTDQVPGITTSYPLLDTQGRVLGVFGLDIELGALSAFLEALKVGSSGVAFIFNEKGEVVAYPDVTRIVKEEGGTLHPVLVGELGDDRIVRCMEEYRKSNRSLLRFTADDQAYMGSVTSFPDSFGRNWKIGMVVPQDDFIGALRDTARLTLLIALAILLTSILLARVLARSIARPIATLANEARRIQYFQFDQHLDLNSSIMEIQNLGDALASMKVGLSDFSKYVPSALVQQLMRTGEAARLGGRKEQLTIFFSDIAGFTSISEGLAPEALMVHLSAYLDEMTHLILAQKGTVDKYIGDAVMAFWGAPIPQADHAAAACRAALDCQHRLSELNAGWVSEGKVPLPTRIGIHTGDAVVGNIGSSERMNYSAIGDAVNLASRLEGANKVYGTAIIVSQDTHDQAGGRFLFRPLDRVAVLGKKQGIVIYELMGAVDGELPRGAEELRNGFAKALECYFSRQWEAALHEFNRLSIVFPHDRATALLLERCRALMAQPPPGDWQGIARLESK